MTSEVNKSIHTTVLDLQHKKQQLRYADHPYCLQKLLHQQWLQQENCDLILCVNGGDIKVHAVVAACYSMMISTYLFRWDHAHGSKRKVSQFTPRGRPSLFWKKFSVDLDFSIMKELVNFMYTGLLTVEGSKASEMLEAANTLGMTDAVGLLLVCQEKFLKSDHVPPLLDRYDTLLNLVNIPGQDDKTQPDCSKQNSAASQTLALQSIVKVECLDDKPENAFSEGWRSVADNMDGKAPASTSVQDDDAGSKICDAEVARIVHESSSNKACAHVQLVTNADSTEGHDCSSLSATIQRLHVSKLQPYPKPLEESMYEQVKTAVEQCLKAEADEVVMGTESISIDQPNVCQRSELTLYMEPLENEDVKRDTSNFQQTATKQEASERKLSASEKLRTPDDSLCVNDICSEAFPVKNDVFRHPCCQHSDHQCTECHKTFRRQNGLTRHMRLHHNWKSLHLNSPDSKRDRIVASEKKVRVRRRSQEGSIYLCDIPGCRFSCELESKMKAHKKSKHGAELTSLCVTCGERFLTWQDLLRHEKSYHHGPKAATCESEKKERGDRGSENYSCMKTFLREMTNDGGEPLTSSLHSVKTDEAVHESAVSNQELNRSGCAGHTGGKENLTVTSEELKSSKDCEKNQFSVSLRNIHMPREVVKCVIHCEICGYATDTNAALWRHQADVHATFHCDKCSASFVEKNDMTRHVNLLHKGAAMVWKCLVCDQTFESSKKLQLHGKDVHNDPKVFPCDVQGCGYKTRRNYNLHIHKVTVHGSERNFLCEKCGKRFPAKQYLKIHKSLCLEQKDHLCSLCGLAFHLRAYLHQHVRVVHQGERKYVCNVCGKHFSHHSNLGRHMLIHNNRFPYPCKKCGQKFRHSNSLKDHISKVHSL